MITFLIIIGLLFLLLLLIALLVNDFDDGLPSSRRRQISYIEEQKNLDLI